LGARYFEKLGELTYTKERTRVNILPISRGIKYEYAGNSKFKLYAALGLRYNAFRESNVLGKVRAEKLGAAIGAGSVLKITKKFFADLFVDYSRCKFKPADFNINIGGLEAGLGFGYEF
jgi:opacity protein-like surface antigen